MDFLDPRKRRAHSIRLMIGYMLIAIALLLAATLLLFASFGYGIKGSTGEVIQNGLLFVDAHPEQASIYINGQDRGKTDGRYVMEAGTYNVELRRDGYRTWKRDFTLEGGNIVRLVYPFLFPNKLVSTDVLALDETPDVLAQSPDRRWLIIHRPANFGTFQVLDTASDKYVVTQQALPGGLFTGRTGAQKLEIIEWSTDNKHFLLKYSFDGGFDYLMVDREKPELSYSVSQTFGRSFTTVTLRDKKFDQLYMLDAPGGQLQAGNVKNKSITAVADGVQAFWPYKENILVYTTTVDAPNGKTLVKLKNGQVTYTVREVLTAPIYLLNYAEFDGEEYLVAGSVADGKTYIYRDVIKQLEADKTKPPTVTTLLRVDNVEYLSFSSNARFIAIQGGAAFSVYDLETKQHYRYDTGLKLAPKQKATWMDGHRMMLINADNNMVVFDYDNLNKQTLMTTNTSFIPAFDRDYSQVFTLSPSVTNPGKTAIVSTDINLDKD